MNEENKTSVTITKETRSMLEEARQHPDLTHEQKRTWGNFFSHLVQYRFQGVTPPEEKEVVIEEPSELDTEEEELSEHDKKISEMKRKINEIRAM